MRTAILIPARLKSTRLADKMLCELDGVPLIKRVYDICSQTDYDTYVVTDSLEIAEICPSFILTEEARNGTERCAMAAKQLDYDYYVNVQGDMPDVRPDMINLVAEQLKHEYSVTTLYTDMREEEQNKPDSVKLIRNGNEALWMGRGMTGYGDWHLGIYGYAKVALDMYLHLDVFIEETVEKLEQLRWLKNGFKIGCFHTNFNGVEINTQEDIHLWNYNNEHKENK